MDSDDQFTSHQTHYARTQIDEYSLATPENKMSWFINWTKKQGRSLRAHVARHHDPLYQVCEKNCIYPLYEELVNVAGLRDFGELLCCP